MNTHITRCAFCGGGVHGIIEDLARCQAISAECGKADERGRVTAMLIAINRAEVMREVVIA